MNIFSSAVESVLLYYLLSQVLPSGKSRRYRQIIGLWLMMLYIVVLNSYLDDSSVKGILILLAHVLYAIGCFDGKLVEKLLWGMAYCVIAVIAERQAFKIAGLIGINEIGVILEPGPARNQVVMIYLLLCTGFTIVVSRLRLKHFGLSWKLQLLLIAFVCSGLVVMDRFLGLVILLYEQDIERSISGEIGIITFFMQLILLTVLYLIIQMGKVYDQNQQLRERSIMEDFERKEFEILKSSLDTWKGWKHDEKAHMQTITAFLEEHQVADALDYVKSLYGDMEQELSVLDYGNPVVNVIIATRERQAKRRRIRFEHQIVWNGEVRLTAPELSALLGNLLDNAIEACGCACLLSLIGYLSVKRCIL